MIYLGIDNGKDGAVVVIGPNGGIVAKHKTPLLKASTKGGKKRGRDEYNIFEMRNILLKTRDEAAGINLEPLVIIEKAQPLPSSLGGVAANYQRGFSFGLWQGLLMGLGIPYQVVTPQAWQKEMLAGINAADTKQAAAIAAQRLWPNENWKKSELAKTMDEGFVDAALIGMFGLRLLSRTP